MDLLSGLASVFQPGHFLLMVVGIFIGLVFGTIPGLSGVTAVALLVPFSYVLGPEAALIMMVGVYAAATCAGSLAANLFNMPGDVMGAATARDGFPMTQRGEAGRAISIDMLASGLGGMIGGLLLILIAPQFARIALRFGPPEYFAMAVLGLACIASLATGSQIKALISVSFGLLLATVGLDPVSGAVRFTFDQPMLQGGIDFIPAIIGFFAVSEIFHLLYRRRGTQGMYTMEQVRRTPKFAMPTLKDLRYTLPTILRSSAVGNIVGILPGAGATVAAFLGYGTEVQMSRDRTRFGKGEPRGVAAPESANNSAAAGSMVPLLTLGIPGGATTAIMLGVFILHGLRPGPLLFRDNPEVTYAIFGSMLVASLLVMLIGWFTVRLLLTLLTIPFEIFSTLILVFAVVGTFAIYNRPVDLWIMLFCGVVGFFAKQYDFPIAAIVLGLVLGNIAENGLVNGLSVTRGSFVAFFTRPVTLGILLLALVFVALPVLWAVLARRRAQKEPADAQT
jgi:putative tricarboxylic transport membrane protein